ncbi:RagB/SusD family nutrient uptake outer membrane protein [Epilithonimonas arachidiradicis]|uniref:SusD-like starch-binding protein associating with outer membrane n=1 Tax=Epilithonimonas arachidiradicis TaxID=1617282 RepID=A0A420DDM2_9FLAO|nr:RagB/SusD family nutrient uptake outer membrane protein [Epilithonimonas arachidiradicis]RKE89924.1 SusD-like starch-binding protein associating with outer membrane [Epilithonimonas arachidiradicis]GGG46349.1 hypothetical protein GCM10007332_04840 [Epilithonimonas arachidiradicis]
MKKYIFIISSLFAINFLNSCSESDLDLTGNSIVNIEEPRNEEQLQLLLNGGYYQMSSVNGYGTEIMVFGDLLGDKLFTFNTTFALTGNKNYNSNQSDFGFYALMYNVIMKCNMVINDKNVAINSNVERMKAEAKILRGYAYFTLVNYYSPAPQSGVNQEYGVPIVLENYDVLALPKRASVAEVFEQIISDLKAGVDGAQDGTRTTLGKTAAKLLLSKVYLTRRAPGDAQLALQYATEVTTSTQYSAVPRANYAAYFTSVNDAISEGQPETIWELDQNKNSNIVTGLGANGALPVYYDSQGGGSDGSRRSLNFTQAFYNSFRNVDVRRGLLSLNSGSTETPKGYWLRKYPVKTNDEDGVNSSYTRNIKILRFAEAQLNRIEALYLTGQNDLALQELNAFSVTSRNGSTYTGGANLLNDILTERSKEFFGEGQRFLDLKRYNLPITKSTNCVMNCDVQPGDKLYVLPISLSNLNSNKNLTQYPGYN